MIRRAAVHVHSDWSYDGQWTLARIANAFAERGYSIVMITEHDRGFTDERWRAHREACKEASNESILLIPGIEYSDPSNTIHILVWGKVPFFGANLRTRQLLARAAESDALCVFAHPSRKAAWSLFRSEWLKHLAGIEIWNRKSDGWSASREAKELISRSGISPIVGHDFHNERQFFPFAICLDVEDAMSEAKVLEAMRCGHFHCEAFGMGLNAFNGSIAGAAARVLQSSRRFASRAYRSAIPRLWSKEPLPSQSAGARVDASVTNKGTAHSDTSR
jgi:hypothetical protein